MTSKLLTKKSGLVWCLFKVYTGVLFLLSLDCATQSFYEVWVSKQKSSLFRDHGNCSLCYKMSRKSVFEETLSLAIQRLYIKDGNCQDFSFKKCSSSTNMVERPGSVILFSRSFVFQPVRLTLGLQCLHIFINIIIPDVLADVLINCVCCFDPSALFMG